MKMKKRIKILRIIPTIDPMYGGPSKTIIDTSLMMANKGFEIDILTGLQKKGSKVYKAKKNTSLNSKKIRIINMGKHFFGDYCFNLRQFIWLYNNRDKYNFVIVHGLWQFSTLMARILLKKNYFIFIHGQLDPWFSENFLKKIKKQIYWFFFEKRNLLNSSSILVTSQGEKKTLKNTYVNTSNINKKVVRYGILKPKINRKKALNNFYKSFPKLKKQKFYLFLGRFHEKKGCDLLIKSIKEVEKKVDDIFLLAGPKTNSNYEKKIQILIDKYKLKEKIIFSDMLLDDVKWGAILASKAMVLSSHGENFGVSLVESMCFGKPVLTTNKVNISNEILKHKAGLISDDSVDDFSKIILRFNKYKKKELNIYSKNAYKCFVNQFDLSIEKNSLNELIKKNINPE